MKKIIISLLAVIIYSSVFSQAPKAYALNDSLAATKENQIGLKYLTAYLPIMDSLWHVGKTMLSALPAMKNISDSLDKEVTRRQLMVDTILLRKKNGEKFSEKFQKNCFARLEATKKALNANGAELDSIQRAVDDWSDTYNGIALLSRVRLRHLIGLSYDKVVEAMDSDEVFTLKGKIIFSRRYLPLE